MRGHKIMKRQKAMRVCTFKPNGLIKGPRQSTTFGLEGVRCNTCLMFKYYTQPQKPVVGTVLVDEVHYCTAVFPTPSVTLFSMGNPAAIITTTGSLLVI